VFYSIRHLTKFRYSSPVSESIMELRMQPRSEGLQRCLSFQVEVTPRTRVQTYRDYLGNVVHHFDVPSAHRYLTIIGEATVDVTPAPELPRQLDKDAWRQLDAHLELGDFWEMLSPSHFALWTGMIEALAQELQVPSKDAARSHDPLQLVSGLNSAIYGAIAYVPKSTRVDSPVDDALESRRGVCQDFAHFQIACLRSQGLPARYVSGYLETNPPPGRQKLRGVDASHAWVSFFCPGIGWLDVDATNNCFPSMHHITIGWGRDYSDVCPVSGVLVGGQNQTLRVAVDVNALGPRENDTRERDI